MKVFLDANVLFTAAHNRHGKAAWLLEAMGEKCCTCTLALAEARKNLEMKYPHTVDLFEKITRSLEVHPTRGQGVCPQGIPGKDKPIFLTALACGATHLLTGDLRHFGFLMNKPEASHGLLVQTVGDFLEQL